jgi:hypothetical protein
VLPSEIYWNNFPNKETYYWQTSGRHTYNVLFRFDEENHNKKFTPASNAMKCTKCKQIIKTKEPQLKGVCFGCGKLKKLV